MWPSGTSVGSFLSHSTLPRDLIPSLHLAKDIGHVPKSNMTLCWSGNRKGTAIKAWNFQWNGQIEGETFTIGCAWKPEPQSLTPIEKPELKTQFERIDCKRLNKSVSIETHELPGCTANMHWLLAIYVNLTQNSVWKVSKLDNNCYAVQWSILITARVSPHCASVWVIKSHWLSSIEDGLNHKMAKIRNLNLLKLIVRKRLC